MSQFNCLITDVYLRCLGVPQAPAQGGIYNTVPDPHLWGAGITQGISDTARHYVQVAAGVLVSTRKGVIEGLSSWISVMQPLNQALGVCLGAD